MKRILTLTVLSFTIILLAGNGISFAETYYSNLYGFSIDVPNDWSKRKPKKPWTLLAYAKLGSGENLNMNVLSAEGLSSINQVPLNKHFYPYYDYVTIVDKKYTKFQNVDCLHCVYKWKESDLRKNLEGKYRLQYYSFQWINDGRLFTITFVDSESNFTNSLPIFEKIIDSIQIHI